MARKRKRGPKKPKLVISLDSGIGGNYEQKAAEAMKDHVLVPGLQHRMIYHDDWCDMRNGRGPCNCNPDVEILTHEEYMARLTEGN